MNHAIIKRVNSTPARTVVDVTSREDLVRFSAPLTHDQERALEKLDAWHTWNTGEPFGLFGAAGTGKTTVIGQWRKTLPMYERVFFLAPTHKAAAVLSESVFPDEAMTIHRALGARQKIDEVTGEERFEPASPYDQPIRYAHVVVVDECSMLGREILGQLLNAQRIHGFKLILMGDPYQLPPVEPELDRARESESFRLCKAPHRIELRQVVRQQGALLQTVHGLRESMGTGELRLARDVQDEEGLVRTWASSAEFLEHFCERALEGARLVAYTNHVVDFVNGAARQRLFPDAQGEEFIPGEVLVARRSFDDPMGAIWYAEQSFVVEHVKTQRHPEYGHLEVTCLQTTCGRSMLVLSKSQTKAWRDHGKKIRRRCEKLKRFGDLTRFKKSIGEVRPGWATTVHKSQGSTWPQTFVVQSDIKECRDRLTRERLLYVAYSRAKYQLHVRV